MSTDRELLELAAKASGPLAQIGRLVATEHEAWKARNKARRELRSFYLAYTERTGVFFDRDDELENGDEDGDVVKFDLLKAAYDASVHVLASARSATSRAIVRAAAEIGRAMP